MIRRAKQELEPYRRAMGHAAGIWQKPWPDLPTACLAAMRTKAWDQELLHCPVGERLRSLGRPDLTRIYDLIQSPENVILDTPLIYAPLVWMSSDEITRTEYHRKNKVAGCEAQMKILETHDAPDRAPPFDKNRANGKSGM